MSDRPCRKHKVCLKHRSPCMIEGWTPPADTSTGNCPRCGVWLQGGRSAHDQTCHREPPPPTGVFVRRRPRPR